MKKSMLILVIVITGFSSFAEIRTPQFYLQQFDENSYVIAYPDTMTQVEPKPCESQAYDFAFYDNQGRYELRYILFSETGTIEDIKNQVNMWALMVISNIAGKEESIGDTTPFKDPDVKKEFNADYGLTSFIQNPQSDFGAGFKYIMVNFYYKSGVGLMCQTILFNNLNVLKQQSFLSVFHSFRFE